MVDNPKDMTVEDARDYLVTLDGGQLAEFRSKEEAGGRPRKSLLAAIDERTADLDGSDPTPEPALPDFNGGTVRESPGTGEPMEPVDGDTLDAPPEAPGAETGAPDRPFSDVTTAGDAGTPAPGADVQPVAAATGEPGDFGSAAPSTQDLRNEGILAPPVAAATGELHTDPQVTGDTPTGSSGEVPTPVGEPLNPVSDPTQAEQTHVESRENTDQPVELATIDRSAVDAVGDLADYTPVPADPRKPTVPEGDPAGAYPLSTEAARDQLQAEAYEALDFTDPGNPAEGLDAGTYTDVVKAEGADPFLGGIDHTRTGLTGDTDALPRSGTPYKVAESDGGPRIQRENVEDGVEFAKDRVAPLDSWDLQGGQRPDEPAAITGTRDDFDVFERHFIQAEGSPDDPEINANAVRQQAVQRGFMVLGDVYLAREEPGPHVGMLRRVYAVRVGRRR